MSFNVVKYSNKGKNNYDICATVKRAKKRAEYHKKKGYEVKIYKNQDYFDGLKRS